eukprot:CAMPEP_0171748186 /NCGR_PEP_ID=MMETSP0991-20121206/39946_1 /TAXON_ID=483369 /ORGANISM="non described non described, Strain CCMP2098" /LENGTH=107 /DNA_ID=CAMNT_0012348481 /DNA_START=698 /DNA_END=1019 /DNA_ORIENTATION=-
MTQYLEVYSGRCRRNLPKITPTGCRRNIGGLTICQRCLRNRRCREKSVRRATLRAWPALAHVIHPPRNAPLGNARARGPTNSLTEEAVPHRAPLAAAPRQPVQVLPH